MKATWWWSRCCSRVRHRVRSNSRRCRPGSDEPPMIRLSGITKVYRMGPQLVHALHHVDLEIAQGEFLAIIGPSGSGKSTLMNIVGCLDRPTEGRYQLDGLDVSRLSDNQLAILRNRRLGFV